MVPVIKVIILRVPKTCRFDDTTSRGRKMVVSCDMRFEVETKRDFLIFRHILYLNGPCIVLRNRSCPFSIHFKIFQCSGIKLNRQEHIKKVIGWFHMQIEKTPVKTIKLSECYFCADFSSNFASPKKGGNKTLHQTMRKLQENYIYA